MKHFPLRALVVAVVFAMGAIPGFAQVTDSDLARAERELRVLQVELDELSAQWEVLVARKVLVERSVESRSQRMLETTLEVERLVAEAQSRAADMYMDAALSGISSFLAPNSVAGAGAGIGYLDEVAKSDRRLLADLTAQKEELDRQRVELDGSRAELDDIVDDLDANVLALNEKLEQAQGRYTTLVAQKAKEDEDRRRREEERQRQAAAAAAAAATTTTTTTPPSGGSSTGGTTTTTTAPPVTTPTPTPTPPPPPPPTSGARACPMAGANSFSDSWGAPRSGGRSHKGTDILAARGTPVVAIEDGVVNRLTSSSLGGLSVYFTGTSGDYYYYAHLDGFAAGIGSGSRVTAGTVLGFNGSTGNAPAHIPHLHFQWAPGRGAWVNPYPMLRQIC